MSNLYCSGSSSTAGNILISAPSNSGTNYLQQEIQRNKNFRKNKRRKEKKIDAAVYGYIRAIRALDRTTVNTFEISQALNLPYNTVSTSLSRLMNNGIKIKQIY